MRSIVREGILSALAEGDYTRGEVRAITGYAHSAIHTWIHRLHDEKCVHIKRWKRPGGPGNFEAVWRIGEGIDAKPPKPVPQSKRGARWRERSKNRVAMMDRARKHGIMPNPYEQLTWGAK